jgi:hypothetical protein
MEENKLKEHFKECQKKTINKVDINNNLLKKIVLYLYNQKK